MPAAKKSAPTVAPTAKPAVSHITIISFSSFLNRTSQAGKAKAPAATPQVPATAAGATPTPAVQAKPSSKTGKAKK